MQATTSLCEQRFTTARLTLGAAALLAAFAFGCAGADGSGDDGEPGTTAVDLESGDADNDRPLIENEAALHLLESVDVGDSVNVKFFEPEPGAILIIETGRADKARAKAADESKLGLAERYRALTGKTAPQSIVAAEQRRRARTPRDRTGLSVQPEQRPTVVVTTDKATSNNKTHQQFKSAYCRTYWSYSANWVNVTDNGSTGDLLDMSIMDSALFAVSGTVRHTMKRRPWWSWETLTDVRVNQGWYSYIQYADYTFDQDFIAYSGEAAGKVYSMCTHSN